MFMDLAKTLRSLTASPISTALDQAHRMARRHLEAGGHVTCADGRGDDGVVLPANVDANAIIAAIAAAFGASLDRRRLAANALIRRPDGRLVVSRTAVERLGGGAFDSGKRVLARLIAVASRNLASG